MLHQTHAVGIGFDWLYKYLTPTQRATIVSGVAVLGFEEALDQYNKGQLKDKHINIDTYLVTTFVWQKVYSGPIAPSIGILLLMVV
jgi:hypothetical protein